MKRMAFLRRISESPPGPVKALAAAVALLALSLALAVSYVQRAQADREIKPAGWDLTFRTPGRFLPVPSTGSDSYAFERLDPGGGTTLLLVAALRVDEETGPSSLCRDAWTDLVLGHAQLMFGSAPKPQAMEQAGQPAAQIIDTGRGLAIRTIVIQQRTAYHFIFKTFDRALGESDLESLEEIWASIKVRDGREDQQPPD